MQPQALTARGAVSYLLENNLLTPQALTDGDLVVADTSRRNRNFTVISREGPCYLIKQGVGPDGMMTVAHEAAVYQGLHSEAGDGFRRYLPRFYRYDEEAHLLVLEFLRDAQDSRAYHTRLGRFPTGLARALGEALGSLHSLPVEPGAGEEAGIPFHPPPGSLGLHRPPLELFREVSAANLQVIQIIQRFETFCEQLDVLRAEWQPETLVHFDLKWDNCLIMEGQGSNWSRRLKLVDWELAGMGDPCWDAGSVFNDYLSFWLLSIPVTGETPPERFPELARYPLEKMQPAMRAFWEAYADRLGLDSTEGQERLLRSARYAAARLVQTAFEQMQMSMQLTGTAVCMLQLGLNILQRPQEAAVHLLGIPRDHHG